MSAAGSGPGGALAAAIVGAVTAAQAQDADRFDQLAADLRGAMAPHVDTVLSTVVRDLLEQQHPDGLAGDDIADVLTRCIEDAAWLPDIEARTLVIVLLGALGVAEPVPTDDVEERSQDRADAVPTPDPPTDAALRRHGLVMVASLCAAAGERPIRLVRAAIEEIHRAETQEMP
ncbi:MAG: hypothetical protein JWN61_3054 [Pseudonocardiales bacterium]|nr:hypothetical protein [Pseudonocardiales bacterium]